MSVLLNMSAYDVNIYDEEAFAGSSVIPFLGFCLFVVSIMIVFLSVVNIVTIKRDFKIFYDSSELAKKPDDKDKKRKIKKNVIILITGIILMIISRIITFYG